MDFVYFMNCVDQKKQQYFKKDHLKKENALCGVTVKRQTWKK